MNMEFMQHLCQNQFMALLVLVCTAIYHYLKIDIVAQIKKFEFTRTENNSFEVELFASASDEEIKKLISNKF